MTYSIMSEELRFKKVGRRKLNFVYGKDDYIHIIAKFIKYIEKDIELISTDEIVDALSIFNVTLNQSPIAKIDNFGFKWSDALASLPQKDISIILSQKENLLSSPILMYQEHTYPNPSSLGIEETYNGYILFDGLVMPKNTINYTSSRFSSPLLSNLSGRVVSLNRIHMVSHRRISAMYRIYQAALRNEYFQSMMPDNFSTQLGYYLVMDSKPAYYLNNSDTKFQMALGIFLTNLYESDINFRLNEEHESESEGEYAKAFMTKRNISKEKLALMNENKFLHNGFSFVELDNSVHVPTFNLMEEKWSQVYPQLPTTSNLPSLRFRKLGKHNALGIYFSRHNCICVDVRDTTSLIHEYGHYLDYNFCNETLSLSGDFQEIITSYRKELKYNFGNHISSSLIKYYSTPTEVFARGFELWISNFIDMPEFNKSYEQLTTEPQYSSFDSANRQKLIQFFNKIFNNR